MVEVGEEAFGLKMRDRDKRQKAGRCYLKCEGVPNKFDFSARKFFPNKFEDLVRNGLAPLSQG